MILPLGETIISIIGQKEIRITFDEKSGKFWVSSVSKNGNESDIIGPFGLLIHALREAYIIGFPAVIGSDGSINEIKRRLF